MYLPKKSSHKIDFSQALKVFVLKLQKNICVETFLKDFCSANNCIDKYLIKMLELGGSFGLQRRQQSFFIISFLKSLRKIEFFY